MLTVLCLLGFGFVAGSEKPVVIRSVIPNGPSYDKLFANDQILKVNGKDVRDAPQAEVISLIKDASGRIELEVVASEDVQDTKNQASNFFGQDKFCLSLVHFGHLGFCNSIKIAKIEFLYGCLTYKYTSLF